MGQRVTCEFVSLSELVVFINSVQGGCYASSMVNAAFEINTIYKAKRTQHVQRGVSIST